MKKEREKINYYFSNFEIGVLESNLGEINDLEYVAGFLNKIVDFEEPDFYAKVGNIVFIMEHFEFDSTRNNKNGSEYKEDLARVERDFNSIPATKEPELLHDTINCTNSSKDYINNIKKQYQKHYSKINNYKNKLIENKIADKETEFKICFFIEDVSCFGNLYNNKKGDTRSLNLSFCDKFLDLFESSSELDYVISVIENKDCINSFWFLSKNNIKSYRAHQIDIENIELISFKHNVVGFNILIPNE